MLKRIGLIGFLFVTSLSFAFAQTPDTDSSFTANGASSVAREKIEWLDIWVVNADLPDFHPRVLLIGDSITKNYYNRVNSLLKGKATIDRLATSKAVCDPSFLAEVELLLSQYDYDVIHFNNGLHGWNYSEQEYEVGMKNFLRLINRLAPDSHLIWATITPCRGGWAEHNDRIDSRNEIALSVLGDKIFGITNLYDLVKGRKSLYGKDGVHYSVKGVRRQALEVVKSIKKALSNSLQD